MKNSNSDIASICLQGLGDKFLFFSICFREVTLEAKSNKLVGWTCNICSDMVPYMHVHKVILLSGCDYLKGLLWSGMQERWLLIKTLIIDLFYSFFWYTNDENVTQKLCLLFKLELMKIEHVDGPKESMHGCLYLILCSQYLFNLFYD